MPADYSQLRVFGCIAYAHVDNGKLEPRAVKCVFLGYGSGVKGYKLWNPETQKVMVRRNVVFNESVMFVDSSSIDTLSDSSDEEEQQEIGVKVEHHDKDEIEIVDNDVAPENHVHDDIVVHHSPLVLQ